MKIYPLLILGVFALWTSCQSGPTPSSGVNESSTAKTLGPDQHPSQVSESIDKSATDLQIEEKILDTVLNLPEIKLRSNEIETQSAGKRHMQVWIADSPNPPDRPYYWVKAGEDNGVSFVSHFNFHVYPDSMRIMYFDTEHDQELTLQSWKNRQPK